jgi:hypothetical protein
MKPIQILLLAMLVVGLWIYLRFLRSRSRDRLVVACVAVVGAAFVAVPNWATQLAHALGVGRGVDLLIYVALLLVGFVVLAVYSQQRHLRQQVTLLAREIAIAHARQPGGQTIHSTPSQNAQIVPAVDSAL